MHFYINKNSFGIKKYIFFLILCLPTLKVHFSGLFFNSLCRYDILQGVQINMGIKSRLLYRLCSIRDYLSRFKFIKTQQNCKCLISSSILKIQRSLTFSWWPFCHIQVFSQCPCILGHPVVARSWPGHNFTSLFILSSQNFFCRWEKCKFRFAFLGQELLEAWTEYCMTFWRIEGKHLYKPS